MDLSINFKNKKKNKNKNRFSNPYSKTISIIYLICEKNEKNKK